MKSYPVKIRQIVPWQDRLGVLFEHHGWRVVVLSTWALIIIGVVYASWPRHTEAVQNDSPEILAERLTRLEKDIIRLEKLLAEKSKTAGVSRHLADTYFKYKESRK